MPKPTLRTKGIAQYLTLCWALFPAALPEVGSIADFFPVFQDIYVLVHHSQFVSWCWQQGKTILLCSCVQILVGRKSEYYTPDIKSADAVVVYDYCYVQWRIASIHADEKNFPIEQVMLGYRALSQLRR